MQVRDIRNDINHAGFSKDCRESRILHNEALNLHKTLLDLPLP